ncbi:hypothetical protein GEMRC1_006402 [Eukaryota sp. GEM-RC1]
MRNRLRETISTSLQSSAPSTSVLEIAQFFERETAHLEEQVSVLTSHISQLTDENTKLKDQLSSSSTPSFWSHLPSSDLASLANHLEKSLMSLDEDMSAYFSNKKPVSPRKSDEAHGSSLTKEWSR